MIEVDCRKCVHCTGEYCEVYGDDIDYATEQCPKDGFKNYITRDDKKMSTNYTIVSVPKYIIFDCPHCHEEDVKVDFNNIDFKTDYCGYGAWVNCPRCGKEIELGDYTYDLGGRK